MATRVSKVFAIIVTYNGMRWVDKCFSSLINSRHPVDVIVVDNNSSDNTVATIREKFPQVLIIQNAHNAGFGGANNQAIKIAVEQGADYVLLLNQDAWIERDTVGCLLESFRETKGYGILSPLHYNGDGSRLDTAFKGYISKMYDVDHLINSRTKQVYNAEFINAAAWMISRKCLEKVGGFGYLFRQYGEDRDYVQRSLFYHEKMGFITTTKIFHDRPDQRFDFSSAAKITWYYSIGSRVRLSDINKSSAMSWISTLYWLLKDIVALTFSGKVYAIRSGLFVVGKVFFADFFGGIYGYRKRIRAGSAFLFIS